MEKIKDSSATPFILSALGASLLVWVSDDFTFDCIIVAWTLGNWVGFLIGKYGNH